jgi:hypothetical protein
MQTFFDATGRAWTVEFNNFDLETIEHLYAPVLRGSDWRSQWGVMCKSDPNALLYVAWMALGEQGRARGINEPQELMDRVLEFVAEEAVRAILTAIESVAGMGDY